MEENVCNSSAANMLIMSLVSRTHTSQGTRKGFDTGKNSTLNILLEPLSWQQDDRCDIAIKGWELGLSSWCCNDHLQKVIIRTSGFIVTSILLYEWHLVGQVIRAFYYVRSHVCLHTDSFNLWIILMVNFKAYLNVHYFLCFSIIFIVNFLCIVI